MSTTAKSLSFAQHFTKVKDALVIEKREDVQWDDSADFVIVGYGGAGVAAANEAIDGGLSVIALDRFDGGGATTMNGGVIYAGGGTSTQKAAGYNDTPEAMFEYLTREVDGIVTDETLRRFCEGGPEMINWLEAHGCRFNSSVYTKKTSYPGPQYYLYFPDNSLLAKYKGQHPPAPRGHKVDLFLSKTATIGFGRGIFEPQRDAAAKAGVRVIPQAEAQQIVVDSSGTVLGVVCRRVAQDHPKYAALIKAQRSTQKWQLMLPPLMPGSQITNAIAGRYAREAAIIERQAAKPFFVRAERGVCLSAGGFIFNKPMVHYFAPLHDRVMPLGTLGDDGSGLMLGYSAGGALNRMDEVSGWRFLNPPAAWVKGMLVNARGARYVDEASYGATVGQAMMRAGNDGVGWLILDRELWDLTKQQLRSGELMAFQRDPARLTMLFKSKKAHTLKQLGKKLGFDSETFANTERAYKLAQSGIDNDKFDKNPSDMGSFSEGPYYALNLNVDSPFFPLPSITIGGLLVDERSGLVLRDDGTTIPGLYAAGRAAIGLCSNLYLSGLSAGDCIFSGRRAAAHAATLETGILPSSPGLSAAAISRTFEVE
jgi:3-oxo-5alpha-steroid 4-dehydrogenase